MPSTPAFDEWWACDGRPASRAIESVLLRMLRRIPESVWSVLAQVVHDEADSTWADRYETCHRKVEHDRAHGEPARRRSP